MDNNRYCIATVGVAVTKKNVPPKSSSAYITFEGTKYLLIININNVPEFLRDVKHVPEFCLMTKTNHWQEDVTYLCLFFIPSLRQSSFLDNIRPRWRIVNRFFDLNNVEYKPTVSFNDQPMETNPDDEPSASTDSPITEVTIHNMYAMLREAHLSEDAVDYLSDNFKPAHFNPSLRFYQRDAVNWMLKRELFTECLPTEFYPIRCGAESTSAERESWTFYYNARTLEILDHAPGDIRIPTGGILADEMGLGKTVEMLALLLSNRRKMPELRCNDSDTVKPVNLKTTDDIMCTCIQKSKRKLIKCPICNLYQHERCVAKTATLPLHSYRCPACWENCAPIESAGTFIVSPPSIKMQWQEEVVKHISDPDFKVLIYNGIKHSGWISPHELARYDIVLTDYNIMKAELYFSGANRRDSSLRNRPRYITPVSPLTMVNWWRVCLDEAQMIEQPVNRSSKMVKLLPAVHRWSITGTPIEKSIHNLYGLLYFLGCEPYTDVNMWKKLTDPFQEGDPIPLITILKKIMWRTCKSMVWDQIGIPPQTEILHTITLSDLQAFFYTSQHSQCAALFRLKARKLGKTLSMFKMNSHTLKLIMDPLRKLRQDCTIPTILCKSDQSQTKKLLSPDELLKHLVSNNEIECKSQLRSVASSLNGLAALYVILEDYDAAIKHYKSVLCWASDYTGAISVDSLLQVHALYNLLDILPFLETGEEHSDEQIQKYEQDLDRLQWKYMENSSQLINRAKEQQLLAEKSIKSLEAELIDPSCSWWRDILCEIDDTKQEEILVEKINLELRINYPSSALESLNSIHGIGFVLTTWLDKIVDERRNLQHAFAGLEFFSKNIKPRDKLDSKDVEKIEHLVQTALLCHLEAKEDEDKKKKSTKEKQPPRQCQLCKVKHVLMTYECVIFNMVLNKNARRPDTTGSWKPTFQEVIMKMLWANSKRDNPGKEEVQNRQDLIKDGETHLAIIEALKNEFKEFSKYWVEINYAASAYDELNMCKSRLKAVDPEEIKNTPEEKSKLNISKYEIDEEMYNFQQQRVEAEKKFLRIQGTLKYLKHLEKNKGEPEVCPICKQVPETKYSVLECGHHMCIVCLTHMAKFYRTYLDCCVCRHKQSFKDIYYVTCKRASENEHADSPAIEVQGDYSRKIEEIVRTILKLLQEDANVKIIIFSHWETILGAIGKALTENTIEFRKKSAQFHRSIDEFKNKDVTCLLLPLASGSKGLNLIEATHVFLVEPILNPAEELQAVGRVHRIGQTKPTFVHRFIVKNTIEETIYNTVSNDKTGKWTTKEVTVENFEELFILNGQTIVEDPMIL